LKILLRDENLSLMDKFLTQDARSIPKLIIWDKDKNDILGEWGPRPKVAAQMVQDYKKEHGQLSAQFKQDLQVWYNKNKGVDVLEEVVDLLALE
ncbi:MAG: thioredoxin family protein, partial [Bacteroidota bacterium]